MKYWDENYGKGKNKAVTKEVTKEDVLNTLAYIKRGHMPDWNYETKNGQSLPNEYYPLHIAMNVAVEAVKALDDDFFAAYNAKINEDEAKVHQHPIF